MLMNLTKVARAMRQDMVAAQIAAAREQIMAQLHETGEYRFQEGDRTITIRVSPPGTVRHLVLPPGHRRVNSRRFRSGDVRPLAASRPRLAAAGLGYQETSATTCFRVACSPDGLPLSGCDDRGRRPHWRGPPLS